MLYCIDCLTSTAKTHIANFSSDRRTLCQCASSIPFISEGKCESLERKALPDAAVVDATGAVIVGQTVLYSQGRSVIVFRVWAPPPPTNIWTKAESDIEATAAQTILLSSECARFSDAHNKGFIKSEREAGPLEQGGERGPGRVTR